MHTPVLSPAMALKLAAECQRRSTLMVQGYLCGRDDCVLAECSKQVVFFFSDLPSSLSPFLSFLSASGLISSLCSTLLTIFSACNRSHSAALLTFLTKVSFFDILPLTFLSPLSRHIYHPLHLLPVFHLQPPL